MTPYNENLNSAVYAVLQTQALALKTLKGRHNASLFSLYNAQGAKITATQKLGYAKNQLDEYNTPIKHAANNINNLSNNILASASQANQYLKQAVTNGAVAAANIQVAANAIVKLAGETGSIYSILNAADFDTETNTLAKNMYNLLNETAYCAEQLSQYAMEASTQIAAVPAATICDDAKNVNLLAGNLLKIASADFDAALQNVNAASNTLGASDAAEKTAEGNYIDIETDVKAVIGAYASANNILNLNLNVVVSDTPGGDFTVSFTPLHNPFTQDKTDVNPVKAYYHLLVKTDKVSTFDISRAQQLYTDKARCCVPVIGPADDKCFSQQINADAAWDTDDGAVAAGNNYAVFIFAIFTDEYKKAINTFDDFLSAPSASFSYTVPLKAPESSHIWIEDKNVNDVDLQISQTVKFSLPAETLRLAVAYSCILLPVQKARNGKLTKNTLGFLFNEVLAAAVTFDNYIVTVPIMSETNEIITYSAAITPATTDNFGNLLIANDYYVPAILAIYNGGEAAKQAWYKPTLSDFHTTTSFKYSASQN